MTSTDWTYDPTLLDPTGTAPTAQTMIVRRLYGDVLAGDQQLRDVEVNYAITLYGSNAYLAAAECSRWLSQQFARQVDITQGELQTNYSQRSKQYAALAVALESRGMARGGVVGGVYAGGISVQDKREQVQNTDRVTPQYNIGMDDNLIIPLPPVGNETPGNPSGGN